VLAMTRSPVLAQKKVGIPRIGLLWVGSSSDSIILAAFRAFRDALRAQGYADGTTVQIEIETLVDRYDRLAEAADRLLK
jgi:hypothetical protein